MIRVKSLKTQYYYIILICFTLILFLFKISPNANSKSNVRETEEQKEETIVFNYLDCVDLWEKESIQSGVDQYTKDGHNEMLYNFPGVNSESIIFDIGGYMGDSAEAFQKRGNPKLFIFEPNPSLAKHLALKFPHATVFEFGLGLEKGDFLLELSHSGSNDGARVVSNKNENTINVKIESFASISHIIPDHVDVFFINCEGCEMSVLPALIQSGFIKRVKYVLVQFHKYSNEVDSAKACEIRNSLSKTHEVKYSIPWVWDVWVLKVQL
jgi:FkbM family methyltransferase